MGENFGSASDVAEHSNFVIVTTCQPVNIFKVFFFFFKGVLSPASEPVSQRQFSYNDSP